ncbi:ADAMTS-like protein 4 isoform X1 [Thamnophis elegans]|uniref:ADAMTS-like protein 4 isoform X1 n=1 Tax=Thamnophis elegans TaxID=35005 RepID=UPI001376DBD4|nr:ADAMTS-like protein 4 isoform X1 [Thamnophis elegans]XP_032090051.1 ADAMTS-like protein 4 isoform X1 [Thamnophis elegans]XP_032090052.1 ADAMTS-like protein 4 isoform X1 [Thamnophis elegans]
MGAAGQSRIGRFCLAVFSLTFSLVALSLASEKVAPRTPRQTSGEEAAESRAPGVWGSWGSWSSCSQPCGLGVLERTRSCQSPYQRDPWAGRTDGAPRPAGAQQQQQQQQQRSHYRERLPRPSGRWPAFPLRSDGNSWSASSVYRGNPHGSTNRHVRQEAGAAAEGTVPASRSEAPRDSNPFFEATRSWGTPLGREGFPSQPRPQRPSTAGGSRTPAQKVIPLYKPARQGGREGGWSQEEESPGSWAASPIPDPQADWRSRVRETIKPGKYGYGRVPFALPLHKGLSEEEGSPRFKRHHGEKTGETPPSSAPSSLLPAAKEEQPWGETPWSPGAERLEGLAGAPEDPTGEAVGLKSRPSGEGDSAAPSSPPQQGPPSAEEEPRGNIPGRPPRPQEDSSSTSHAGGSRVAAEGAGGFSSQRPPPHAPKDLRRAPPVPKSQISASQDKGPGRGPNPRATPGRPPRLSLDPHLPSSRARSRNQRQQQQPQPRGGGRGPRPSHHLFVDQPGLRGPSEADIWLLHRGSPLPLHAGWQRPQAETPQWNLYAPGTETFHCEGENRQFRACRQQPCPPDRPDPRTVQCAAYNDQEFMGRFYQWEPFTEVWGSRRCELNCRPLGYRFYVRHTEKVQDGTPCEASSQDICVAGQCLTPGCDGILGSNRTLDECGVCGGDHTACKLVSGNYSETNVPIGYHRILQIPAGATQIQIREMSRSPNYLALRTQNGKSIINGNWAVNPPGHYEAAGTVFIYRDQEEGELLTADGPTTRPVELYMIFQQDNPGVSYQFLLAQPEDSHRNARRPQEGFGALAAVEPPAGRARQLPSAPRRSPVPGQPPPSSASWGSPREAPPPPAPASQSRRSLETLQRSARVPPLPPPPPPVRLLSEPGQDFAWRRFGNTECSASCGKGFWKSVYRCVSRASQEEVGEEKCHQIPKPLVEEEICNTDPCPAFWDAGEWSACSRSCGPGTQHRQVLCRQIYANRTTMVHPQRCGHLEKPEATQDCQVHFCSHWEVQSNWSSCSALCGPGHRTRRVSCVSNHGELLRDTDCPENHRPQSSEPCTMGPCVRSWFYSDWSNTCSADCGTGIQRRSVVCLSSNADGQADEDCATPRPSDMRACDGGPCQRVTRWYKGPWSSCSVECGYGTQRRDIICVSKEGTQFSVTEAAECAHLEKPPPLQPCVGTDCEARWFSTNWSTCSRSCQGGVQAREVQCLTQNKTLSAGCPLHLKPATKRPCNSQPCLPSLDATCRDKYPNCAVIVQARLCVYSYYQSACCVSCSHALERRHVGDPSR